jgi:signal peptidase II
MFLALGVAVVAADQATKYLAVSRLTNALDGRQGLSRAVAFVTHRARKGTGQRPQAFHRALPPYTVIPNYWQMQYVENRGAAWGLMSGLPEAVRRPFFHVVIAAALLGIFLLFRSAPPDARLLRWGLTLIGGGAVGNWLDRVMGGYVIDFIDWHWRHHPELHWATFNVADVAVTVGVVLVVLDGLRGKKRAPAVTSVV